MLHQLQRLSLCGLLWIGDSSLSSVVTSWTSKISFLPRKIRVTAHRALEISASCGNNSSMEALEWKPLSEFQDINASNLVNRSPQMAKDVRYAEAIQTAWREEIAKRSVSNTATSQTKNVQWTKISYKAIDSNNGAVPLYGYCLRCHREINEPPTITTTTSGTAGIVLFHTGAGPHDIFLLWKADSLLHELPNLGYVLIADILSDETGWGWNPDRSRYDRVRAKIFEKDGHDDHRRNLQHRVTAALTTLCSFPDLNVERIGAMGWCLGGQPIWELATMNRTNNDSYLMADICCMATFHGVCDGFCDIHDDDDTSTTPSATSGSNAKSSILICNGGQDPFVSKLDLNRCIQKLRQHGHSVRVLDFPDARHGFTNPAQAFNNHAAFDFHLDAAREAWQQAILLFRERLTAGN